MRTLVTGGAGYIGSHVALALRDAGHHVIVVDDLSNGDRTLVPDGAHFVMSNFTDPRVLNEIVPNVDAVLHFAGSIVVPESVTKPFAYWANNTSRTLALIEAAAIAQVRGFVFSSTAAVYGEPATVPIPETAPRAPINPYGQSKCAVEWVLEAAGIAHDLPWTALRYFNVAGADPKGRAGQLGRTATHLIKIAAGMAVRGDRGLQVFGTDFPTPDGTCVRDYVHVADLAAAHVHALDRLVAGASSTVFNVGYGSGASVREVVDAVERMSGHDLAAIDAPPRPGDPAQLIADPAKLMRETGWRPRHAELDRIVDDALAWERRRINA